ncbi:TrlF family AAA-like ATPase [Tahibacter amnicola]|uniref:ABC transporter n=1 Tax=Tahibacter amnicola TaxID=2976241 RepID=A0ABY6B8M8_9GAMM|nr:ABC transporter [Tahibacter amnicola]UXI66024.1 ABC transporter [Tahibacter amnicola]
MADETTYERGSEWRQWDLHVHTPASFHWRGKKFQGDPLSDANKPLVDEMIAALNAATPAVFALMDYWTFDGWFALRNRLKDADAPPLTKTVFPGIELRLAAPTKVRLNAHVLFSDHVDDQTLRDFQSRLKLSLVNRPLSDAALVDLARNHIGEPKLLLHGHKKAEVDADDAKAYLAGAEIAELTCESYQDAIARVPNDQAIGYMPYDTSDGLKEVKWQEHYAYFLGLVRSSPIFESRNLDIRGAFVNEPTPGNAKYIDDFQQGLQRVPRLVVAGSDAHCFVGTPGDNDRRGYGDFPSGKATWIKADPTFRGLQQAIMEPAKRSHIGQELPPKLAEVAANKHYFIESIEVEKEPTSNPSGDWLTGTKLPLNTDLVAIIGNKGSGKSALTDVLALLGNSRQSSHFTFLTRNRFRGKSGDPAKHFVAKINWLDGSNESRNLNSDPSSEKVELVRYIPQGHFEELCNAHVSGRSDAFENELRSVIFSHADEAIRLGALDFDQLIEQQEKTVRQQLNEFRKDLRRINQEIATYEEQLQPDVKRSLEEQLALKQRQIDEHQKLRPPDLPKPDDQLTPEQQQVSSALDAIAQELQQLDQQRLSDSTASSAIASKLKAIQNVREQLRLIERTYGQFVEDTARDLATLGLKVAQIASFTTTNQPLNECAAAVASEQEGLKASTATVTQRRSELVAKQGELKAKLNEPQLLYQNHLKSIENWTAKQTELTGTADAPDTFKGLEARIAQIDELPGLLEQHRARRAEIAGEIFDTLDAQRRAREELFKPVQDLIQNNSLIRDDYKLQFRATLAGSIDAFATSLFTLIKQTVGEFRGEDDSFNAVRRLAEPLDFNKREEALAFADQLSGKIASAATSSGGKAVIGIAPLLRKDKTASEVYDLVYGMSFLEPRYSLLFQDTQIEQLSPGQRGALLLIFYLLVDKGRNPIILDQPEENLDNETVVSLLVPVLTQAKKRRQIIMATHNPNLAVVCDAEQIIWSNFDRKTRSRISYAAGSIENPATNRHVVDVLEGTKPAFDNRRIKYL